MHTVLAHLCVSRDEFIGEVAADERAQVKLEALSMGHCREAGPSVRIVLTAAIAGVPPRWLTYTEDLGIDHPDSARAVARQYAGEVIARGLRPASGRWTIEEVSRLSGNGGFSVVPGRVAEDESAPAGALGWVASR